MKVWGLVQSFPSDYLEDKMFGFEPKHRSFSFFSRRRRRRRRRRPQPLKAFSVIQFKRKGNSKWSSE